MKRRNIGLDLLRVVAMFSVIVIHLPGVDADAKRSVLRWFPYGNACFAFLAGWFMSTLVRSTSGMDTYKNYLRKRCGRLLLPYAVWSIIHITLSFALSISSGSFAFPSMLDWYHYVFCGYGAVQLWFIASLLYAQLALAIILIVWPSALLLFSIGVASVYGCSMLMPVECAFRNHVFIFGFTALGLSTRIFWERSNISSWVTTLGMNITVVMIGCMGLTFATLYGVGHLWPLLVFVWCAVFGALGAIIQMKRFPLGELVMGIYLSHWLVLRALFKPILPTITNLCGRGAIVIVLVAILAFIVSAILSKIFSKQHWLMG